MSDLPPGDVESIAEELMASGLHDWVSLHDLVLLSTKGDRSATGKQRATAVLRYMFTRELMVPGDLGESGFEDWVGSPEDLVTRVVADIERLNWNPMGDGCWLRVTDQVRGNPGGLTL